MSTLIQSLHVITVSDFMGYVEACLAPQRLAQTTWWTTLVWCAWFPVGWCRPEEEHRSAKACFFRNTGTTSINFPVWYHRWWSNFCEFQGQENTTGLSYGLAMFISCTGCRPCSLVLFVKEIRTCRHTHLISGIRHVWFKQVLCNNLSFDLVHSGEIGFPHNVPPSAAPQER